MEMADSESSDDASGNSSKQSTDNTISLKKKLNELQRKLANIDQLSYRFKAKHSKKRKYRSGLPDADESTSSRLLDESTPSSSDSTDSSLDYSSGYSPKAKRRKGKGKRKVEKEAANRYKFTALLKTQASVVPFLFEDLCSFVDFKEAIAKRQSQGKQNPHNDNITLFCEQSRLWILLGGRHFSTTSSHWKTKL